MLKLKKKKSLHMIRFGYQLLTHPSTPIWGTVFITRQCNLRCPYCSVPLSNTPDISAEHWFRIIDRIVNWGVRALTIVGGEPLIRQDLEEIIAHANSKGLLVSVHSNFHLITQNRIKTLSDAGLTAITASLDNFGEYGKNNMGVLGLLRDFKKQGVVPIVSALLTEKNANVLPELATTVINQGLIFNFGIYQHVGGNFSKVDASLIPSRSTIRQTTSILRKIKRSTGGVRSTNHFLTPSNLDFYHLGWKCNPQRDSWLDINNDGLLMCCQEHPSPFDPLSLPSLSANSWRDFKIQCVRSCKGCYHHCYFDAEELRGKYALRELSGIIPTYIFNHRSNSNYSNT